MDIAIGNTKITTNSFYVLHKEPHQTTFFYRIYLIFKKISIRYKKPITFIIFLRFKLVCVNLILFFLIILVTVRKSFPKIFLIFFNKVRKLIKILQILLPKRFSDEYLLPFFITIILIVQRRVLPERISKPYAVIASKTKS